MASSGVCQPTDLLHQLPNELLVLILEASPDFSTLWSLAHTTPALLNLFRSQALTIFEAVLEASVPTVTQTMMKKTLGVRAGHVQFTCFSQSLSVFVSTEGPTLRSFTTQAVVLDALDLAHRVQTRARYFTKQYLQECLTIMRLDFNKAEQGPQALLGWEKPSWNEEQRVLLAFWRVQYYLEAHSVQKTKQAVSESLFTRWNHLHINSLAGHGHTMTQMMAVVGFLPEDQSTGIGRTNYKSRASPKPYRTRFQDMLMRSALRKALCSTHLDCEETAERYAKPPLKLAREPKFSKAKDFVEVPPMWFEPMWARIRHRLRVCDKEATQAAQQYGIVFWDSERLVDLHSRVCSFSTKRAAVSLESI